MRREKLRKLPPWRFGPFALNVGNTRAHAKNWHIRTIRLQPIFSPLSTLLHVVRICTRFQAISGRDTRYSN